jgi:ActD protein
MTVLTERIEGDQTEVETRRPYGIVAEFATAEQLLGATRRAHAAGFRQMDAYTPFPVEGLSDALGFHPKTVPLIGLIGGMVGAATGYAMQFFIHAISLPINVGGRPLNSWPSFIPVTFEMGVLFSALSLFFGILILNKLPQPYHPLFDIEAFARASRDRFFLCIEARDPHFDFDATRQFLLELGALEVADAFE